MTMEEAPVAAPRVARVVRLLDLVGGLLVAGSLGLWLMTWNLAQATGADPLFLPTVFQDVHAQGLGALRTWHYGSSSFAVPDVLLFAVAWFFSPHFQDAIPAYAGAVAAASVGALWLALKPSRASFAVFSATFCAATAAYIELMRRFVMPYNVVGWYRYAALSAHHYGNIVNVLLALAVFLWWRSAPSPRRLATLTIVVLVGVLSDLLFVVTFVPAAVLVDLWLRDGSVLQYVRKRWALPVSFALATILGIAGDAAVNPLSPLRAPGGPKQGALSALGHFVEVRFSTRPQANESLLLIAAFVFIIVVATRARRDSRRGDLAVADRAILERRAAVHAFLLLSVVCDVGATIAMGKYTGFEVDRYILPLAFFPLFSVFGLLGMSVAERVPPRVPVLSALALAGLLSVWMAKARCRFESVEPPYVACIERLGLGATAGFAPYWVAKPLLVFSERRVQVVQVLPEGRLYSNLVNDRWAAQDWFGGGSAPQLRFALMATDETHGKMVDGSAAFENDGMALDPAAMRRGYGQPDSVRICNGATFWTYRAGQLAGHEPIPVAGLVNLPLHLRATHASLSLGHAVVEDDQVRATGEEGTVLFGPYLSLPPGRYRARWSGTGLARSGTIAFDVAAVGNPVPLARAVVDLSAPTAGPDLVTLHFELPRLTNGVETRVFALDGAKFALDGMVLERE